MAPLLGLAKRLFLASASLSRTSTRSAFIARKRDNTNPNWVTVGLCFGTTAVLWVLLFKKHHDDVIEYERRMEEKRRRNMTHVQDVQS